MADSEPTREEKTRRLDRAITAAGDGDWNRGIELLEAMMLRQRNAGIFIKFAAWGGGMLIGGLAFGKDLWEALAWFVQRKFGL